MGNLSTASESVHPAELLRKVEADGFAVVSSCLSEETVRRLASASAIAASLVSAVTSTSGNRSAAVPISVKFAVVSLIFSIVASVFTIIALSRGYDRERARFSRDPKSKGFDLEQGELNDTELRWILGSAYVGLTGFLLGFLFIGRIVFQN